MVISNISSELEIISNQYRLSGLQCVLNKSYDNYEIEKFTKSNLVNTNECFLLEDDFVSIIGTCLTKTKTDNVSEFIYEKFDGNIKKLRELLIGNYTICIRKKATTFIFCDDYSTNKIYYQKTGDKFVIANSLYCLASSKCETEINTNALIELAFQFSTLGNETTFQNVFRLLGNEYIKITSSGELVIESFKYEAIKIRSIENMDLIASELGETMKKYFKIISEKYERIAINMTGGIDSRIILAGFLSVGAKPVLIYGKGNSPITNTKEKDLELIYVIAKRYDLKTHIMNWNTAMEIGREEYLKDLVEEYHEYFLIYGANSNVLEEYSVQIPDLCDFVEFGYFGEMIRNLPWVEEIPQEKITINKLISNYLYFDPTQFLIDEESFSSNIKEKIQRIVLDIEDKTDYISKDNFQQFHAHYRYSSDTVMNNFVNLHTSSVIMQGIPEVHEKILSIPFNIKKNASFQLRLINSLFPDLLNVPFFSHAEEWVFNLEEFELRTLRKKSGLKNSRLFMELRKIVFLKRLYKRIKILFFNLNEEEKNNINQSLKMRKTIVKKVKDLQKELSLTVIVPENYSGDIRGLLNFYHLLFMIKTLRENQILNESM